VVFGKSIQELSARLETVFQKIGSAGLKLKAKKCVRFHNRLKYLGHIVSDKGVSCDACTFEGVAGPYECQTAAAVHGVC